MARSPVYLLLAGAAERLGADLEGAAERLGADLEGAAEGEGLLC